MLLGLLREGTGVGFHVLKNLGADPSAIRRKVEALVKQGPRVVTMGKLPLAPRSKRVIEFAIREARTLGHNYVGTEHLLLGLLTGGEGIAALILSQFGIQEEAARAEVLRLLASPDPPPESDLRLYHVEHEGKSSWVEAPDIKAAVAVWKRHFWEVPSADESVVGDPESIELVFDGPVWR